VRGLADEAAHLVLFPRPDIERDVGALLGVDLADPTLNATVVAEGVDLAAIDRARTAVATHDPHRAPPPHLADLDDLLSTLPEERRHLPLAVTVGRLHPVKGVATLVETWAQRRELGERCNLLVVGGALDAPNVDEAGELDRIAAAVPPEQAAARGLLLAGHRPHAGVAVWLAAARLGRPGLAAPDGVYVSASLKEEFGIAILEAMSAGLVVVAPDAGGPATYVDEGVTGVLADTTSPAALAEALTRALDLASDADAVALADLARSGLRDRFGIDTMASALARVYASVSTPTAPATRHAALPGGGR
jgi:glycosyltransferase involved in cell wall biosynthesis